MRFFQWVDEHGHYNSKSIVARLITRPNRIIRDDATEAALDQAELDKMSKLSLVRVKWFISPHYRLPARILPHFHIDSECDFLSKLFLKNIFKEFFKELIKRLDLGDGDVDKKRRLINQIRSRPVYYKKACIARLADTTTASDEDEEELNNLAKECAQLESKIATLDGLNSAATESIRLKFNRETQRAKERRYEANIVFATEIA